MLYKMHVLFASSWCMLMEIWMEIYMPSILHNSKSHRRLKVFPKLGNGQKMYNPLDLKSFNNIYSCRIQLSVHLYARKKNPQTLFFYNGWISMAQGLSNCSQFEEYEYDFAKYLDMSVFLSFFFPRLVYLTINPILDTLYS